MKIRNKLLLLIIVPFVVIFAGIFLYIQRDSHKVLYGQISARADSMLKAYSWHLDSDIVALENMTKGIAVAVEGLRPASDEELQALIKKSLENTPKAYGSTIAFEPNQFSIERRLVAPYYYKVKDDLKFMDLGATSYNYPAWEWYSESKQTGKPRWSPPYFDEGGGGVPMVTYSVPFFRDGKFWGVATADVALESLTGDIEKIKVGDEGFAFLINKDGKFISMREGKWSKDQTLFSIAYQQRNNELSDLAKKMVSGDSGFVSMMNPLIHKQSWFIYGPIPSTGWILCIVFPEKEMLAELLTLHRNITIAAVLGILIMTAIVFFISAEIARPIGRLSESARKISEGDFSAEIEVVKAKDEVGVLARAFREMKDSLAKTLGSLKEEKEMFGTCFSKMSDGIVILQPDFKVLKFNETAARFLMLPAKGDYLEHIKADFDSSTPFERIMEGAKLKPQVFELSRRKSEQMGELHLLTFVTPILDAAKGTRLMVMSIRDMTKEETEERSKRNFLSVISHKLKTPVTVLRSSISIVEDGLLGELTDKQKRHIASMSGQISKLDGLIEELIGFVTIEQAELDTSKEEIALKDFLENVSSEIKAPFVEKHPDVEINIDAQVDKFNFNKNYLKLVVGQLIENGLKFNLSDPARISVNVSKQGDEFTVKITDNGVGIPPEYQDKIFNKFYQIEKYFTGNIEGVGLGLTYVKRIVEHFGGSVLVQSKPGEGSTFTVSLPL